MRNASARENHPTREKATRGGEREKSPFLVWGDFHACSRFTHSTISEEKWGTTRSLYTVIHCESDAETSVTSTNSFYSEQRLHD